MMELIFLKKRNTLKLTNRVVAVFLLIISTMPFYISGIIESSVFKYGVFRIKSLIIGDDVSSLERLDRFSFTINTIFDTPFSFLFGNGIGSFGILYLKEDIRAYAHNIYLETWFELGFLGLTIMLFFTLIPFFLKRDLILKVICFYFLLNAQKTGSLADLWVLFGFYGVLIFNPKNINQLTNLKK